MIKKLLVCCIFGMLLAGCGNNASTEIYFNPDDFSNWKSFDDPEFTFFYPNTWQLQTTSDNPFIAFQLYAGSDHYSDDFRENVNLMVDDIPVPGYNLDNFVEEKIYEIESISDYISGSSLLLEESVILNGHKAHRIISTGRIDPHYLKFEQYLWVENRRTFEMTLTCEVLVFSKYMPVWRDMAERFVLK